MPQQRGNGGGGEPTLNSIILDGIQRVQDSVDKLAVRFDGLSDRFMPRVEITARFDESLRDRGDIRQVITEGKAKHDTDIARLTAEMEAMEVKRATDRRAVIASLYAAAGLVLTLLGIIAALIH